jgi:hypothetical protein
MNNPLDNLQKTVDNLAKGNDDKYLVSTDFYYKKGNDLINCFATDQKAYRVNNNQIAIVDSNNKLIGFVEYNPALEERFEMVKEV